MNLIPILLLAMIAAFLGLRLYSVLGKRTGHEQKPLSRTTDESTVISPSRLPGVASKTAAEDDSAQDDDFICDAAAEEGIRALLAADRHFDTERFLEGAKSAYRMILEAFWSGDRVALRELANDEIYEGFDAAITEKEKKDEKLKNRLVRIDRVRIVRASVTQDMARVTVRFTADIVAITCNAAGDVIAGSLTDAVVTTDIWTFSRPLDSSDPNWKLEETETG